MFDGTWPPPPPPTSPPPKPSGRGSTIWLIIVVVVWLGAIEILVDLGCRWHLWHRWCL